MDIQFRQFEIRCWSRLAKKYEQITNPEFKGMLLKEKESVSCHQHLSYSFSLVNMSLFQFSNKQCEYSLEENVPGQFLTFL